MPLELVKSALESRGIRKAIGTRVISALQTKEVKDDKGGIIGRVLDFASRGLGFLWTKVFGFIGRQLNFSNLWSSIIGTARFLLTFNFNITDEDLDKQIKQYELAVYSQLGTTVGGALGYLICGFIPSLSLLAVNEMMAARALRDVGEEFLEEFSANISGLIQVYARSQAQKAFATQYKNVRRWLKKPDNVLAQIIFGDNYGRVMNAWGKKGSKPFVISEIVEEWIEKIPNEKLRLFLDSALEELIDSCVEAGYVVANSMDSFIAAQKMQNANLLGEKRIVEIQPNRQSKEIILLAGPQELLKPQIVQTMATHSLIANRDVGQIVGYDSSENVRARPQLQRIVFRCHNHPETPFRRNGVRNQAATIKVPDVPRSKLDWNILREAVGGSQGYLWGRFLATANLDNGRQLQCYGGSQSEAEKRLNALAKITTAKIMTVNFSEETKLGVRGIKPQLQKQNCIVYPGYVTIFVYKAAIDGRTNQQGQTFEERSIRLDLWGTEKPIDWDEQITELFRGNVE